MFHQGDLQSGIGKALTEQKLVACFIQSDNEESRTWEQQWLMTVWAEKAVLLKLEYGSTEAGFLAAFCPITTSPTLVVIDKGTVLEKIEAGVSQQDFMSRVNRALGLVTGTEEPTRVQPTQPATASPPPTRLEAQQPTTSSSSDSTSTSPDMSSLFPDRAQRHQVEAAKRAAAEKAERIARASARKKEEATAALDRNRAKGKGRAVDETETEKSKAAARRDWITQQKIRKDEAKKDRERILAQIEADKQERKARSQRPASETSSLLPTSVDAASKRRMGAGGMCSLQIRLFDGTSIKSRFEPSATLDKHVRGWIKTTAIAENAADIPFTFKQIIAPKPSRSIEVSEEHQTLSDLGLTPNATLVLVPVAGYTEAYAGNAGRGYMSSALHYTYALANGASSVLGSALSYVPGLSGPGASASRESLPTNSEGEGGNPSNLDGSVESIGSARVKMKTLADQRAEDEREKVKNPEFYNGNSSAFEGRKDDE